MWGGGEVIEKCVKCGEEGNVGILYVGECMYLGRVVREHLKMTCRRCNYEWSEPCMDSKESK